MATCPLCSSRAGKRYCPAKQVQICAVCCGTKREIEIDCPGSCVYLRASHEYEADKRIVDVELAAKAQKYDDAFVYRYGLLLELLSDAVVRERNESPWLVDNDLIEVFKALSSTMKTLSSGIYYESLPEGSVRLSLFRRLKAVLDELMAPSPDVDRPSLKVAEAVDILDFLTIAAQMNSSIRPKSRRYLDWLSSRSGVAEQPSGIIIP